MQSVFSSRFLPQNKDFLSYFPYLAVLSHHVVVILQPISERYHAMISSSELQTVDTCRPFLPESCAHNHEKKITRVAKRLTLCHYNRIQREAAKRARIKRSYSQVALLDDRLQYQTRFQEEALRALFPQSYPNLDKL